MTRKRIAVAFVVFACGVTAMLVPLVRGGARGLPRATWPSPAPSATDWRDVFDRGGRVEWHPLDTGAVHVARAKMLAHTHPRFAEYQEEPTALRVYAHLIRHERQGDYLVDSGLDATFATSDYGNIKRPARWLLALLYDAPYDQVPGTDIASQLARFNARPHGVFFTHLHMDHTAGVPALPKTTALIAGEHEADDPVQVFAYGHIDSGRTIHELDFAHAVPMPPLGPAIDVFGDGSFWAVSTPGHTRGHTSFVANTTTGPVLLVGDASHFNWAFAHDVGPSGTSGFDDAVAQRTLDQLRAFADAYPEVTVFCGHEAPR